MKLFLVFICLSSLSLISEATYCLATSFRKCNEDYNGKTCWDEITCSGAGTCDPKTCDCSGKCGNINRKK